MKKRVALVTLGCPKNQVDSEVAAGLLHSGGWTVVPSADEADAVFVNTCAFIGDAKKESIQTVLDLLERKKQNPQIRVYVWGCLAERYRDEIAKLIPEVDGFFGVEPFEALAKRFCHGKTWDMFTRDSRVLSTPPHTAYLKISDGCDHRCTFCAIPLFKGNYRSFDPGILEREAKALVSRGVRELTLIAQDTTAYGRDIGESLASLLDRLVGIPDLRWIRILYGHPAHVTDDLIERIAAEEKICKYLDLPLQHADDAMLAAMGRPTRREDIERLIGKLRNKIPNLTLRTTFIVGFPGETETMFEALLDFVRGVRFERMGAFAFSPEEDTAAFSIKPRVLKRDSKRRLNALMRLQAGISTDMNRSLESTVLPVMADGFDENAGCSKGRTQGDAYEIDQTVWIRGRVRPGEIIPVRIEGSSAYDLVGVPLDRGMGLDAGTPGPNRTS
jgi:ribosomal protein S12 methylthiotransferase